MVLVDRASLARSFQSGGGPVQAGLRKRHQGVIDTTGAFAPDGPGEPTAAEGAWLLLRRAYADALPLALAGEWTDREQAGDYHALKVELERRTPFDAAQRALDRRAYRDRLIRAVDAPLRTLAPELIRCSLNDLYVPLRAMVGDPDSPESRVRHGEAERKRPILWLDDALYGWATRPNPASTDAIRVLSGEPGAGKSSACAMLAARLAGEGRTRGRPRC